MPIEFYQVINLKTARALDINIAPSLLAMSDGSNERIAAVNWSEIDGMALPDDSAAIESAVEREPAAPTV
jgi:hypothetical protein